MLERPHTVKNKLKMRQSAGWRTAPVLLGEAKLKVTHSEGSMRQARETGPTDRRGPHGVEPTAALPARALCTGPLSASLEPRIQSRERSGAAARHEGGGPGQAPCPAQQPEKSQLRETARGSRPPAGPACRGMAQLQLPLPGCPLATCSGFPFLEVSSAHPLPLPELPVRPLSLSFLRCSAPVTLCPGCAHARARTHTAASIKHTAGLGLSPWFLRL